METDTLGGSTLADHHVVPEMKVLYSEFPKQEILILTLLFYHKVKSIELKKHPKGSKNQNCPITVCRQ